MRPKGSSSGHGQCDIQNRAIYLRGEGWTLQQIGDMIGVSRAYVHQLLTTPTNFRAPTSDEGVGMGLPPILKTTLSIGDSESSIRCG
jgi:hypothetical protein